MGNGKWLNCRLRDIQECLNENHRVSLPVISRLLNKHNYRLRANVKQLSGKQHPDRNRQFEHICEQRAQHHRSSAVTSEPCLTHAKLYFTDP